MKSKKDLSNINIENAEEICSSIKRESSEEAQLLLDKANKERERILSEASVEADARSQAIFSAAEKELAEKRERIFSTVTMEKRRIDLEAKSLFIADVIAAVKKEAQNFRGAKDYVKFLRKAILEGVKIIDDKKAQVFYSHLDESVIAQLNDINVEFKKGDFTDIGVIVQSQDGRLLFDNRFAGRLKRAYDEIYMKLLKEAF
ncbi:MAG: V-type ATP synthase subunit E family protein [Candidatus Omnitrophota bacterium]|nr:V-type ATP synthase subunit E family protein [Candidatus Omnitrophota bacterium]